MGGGTEPWGPVLRKGRVVRPTELREDEVSGMVKERRGAGCCKDLWSGKPRCKTLDKRGAGLNDLGSSCVQKKYNDGSLGESFCEDFARGKGKGGHPERVPGMLAHLGKRGKDRNVGVSPWLV